MMPFVSLGSNQFCCFDEKMSQVKSKSTVFEKYVLVQIREFGIIENAIFKRYENCKIGFSSTLKVL